MTRIEHILRTAPLAIALTFGASAASAQDKAALDALTERLRKVEDNTSTSQINMLTDMATLKLKLESIERRLAEMKPVERSSAKPVEAGSNEELLRRIEAISKELRELKESLPTGEMQSKRIDTLNVPKPGKVRFNNQYPSEMTIVVNGRRYELPPMQDITVSVPAGSFNYQVLQLQPVTQSRPLRENETFTIDIK